MNTSAQIWKDHNEDIRFDFDSLPLLIKMNHIKYFVIFESMRVDKQYF